MDRNSYLVRHRAFVLLLAAVGMNVAHAGLGQQHAAAILEAIPQNNLVQGRNALEKWEQQAATESGVMNIILGNTCFTTAIAGMKQGCTKMDSTTRCWLAIQFTVCFQRASGFKQLDCAITCPRYRRLQVMWGACCMNHILPVLLCHCAAELQSCVEDCTARMDTNTYTTYTHFFSDVFNMCLFLQTQNFQEWTTALVQDMHLQTAAANASLGNIKGQLAEQHQALQQSLQALANLQSVQQHTAEAAQAGLSEVRAVGQLSLGLQQSMNQSLALTDALSGHQVKLLQGFSDLAQQQKQQAEQALQAWQQLAADAAALEERQVRYESLQSKLLNASEGLLSQSQGMSSLLDLLLHYQQTGSTLLTSLHSSSTTLQDVAFYIVALSVPLCFFTHPPESRLLLLLAVLVAWVMEKAVVQYIAPLHQVFGGGVGAGGVGGKTPAYFHSVKMGVRLGVMGSGAGLVLWLLFRRQAARNRKEQIFEELRRSVAEAAAFAQPFPMPPQTSHLAHAQACAQQHVHTHSPAPTAAAAAHKGPSKTGSKAAAATTSLPTAAAPITPAAAAGDSKAAGTLALAPIAQQQQQQQHSVGAWLQQAYHHPHLLVPQYNHLPTAPAAILAGQHPQHPHAAANMHASTAHAQQPLLLPAGAAAAAVHAPALVFTTTTAAAAFTSTLPPEAAAANGDEQYDAKMACDEGNGYEQQQSGSQQPTASAARSGSQRRGSASAAAAASGRCAAGGGRGKAKATGTKRRRVKAAVAEDDAGDEEESEPAGKQAAVGKRTHRRSYKPNDARTP